ncbi:MAG: VOC family protein [Bacteroidota bacterium]
MNNIDHLVYATPELEQGIQEIEELLGVRATPGGQHPNWGTHNALVSLGPTCYLEIIAPDPRQTIQPSIFQLASLQHSKLVTWAAKARLSPDILAEAKTKGLHFGGLIAGARQKPDGTLLQWQLTDPTVEIQQGMIPFLIDWGESAHPAASAVRGGALKALRLVHPNPRLVQSLLDNLQIALEVEHGDQPKLQAKIEGLKDTIWL